MSLKEIRQKIDEIDAQLLPLFVQRMKCAETVAETKLATNQPIFNPQREEEILNRVASRANEYDCEAKMLYTTMMALSRARQHKMMHSGDPLRKQIQASLSHPLSLPEISRGKRIACPGAQGSHSHEAAKELFPNHDLCFYEYFQEVFEALASGEVEFGLVPVENSSAGSVTDVYDLILKYRFHIVGAVSLQIQHCLAATPKASLDTIQTVCSHPQALAQCSERIAKRHWDTAEYSNTATAAKRASQQNDPSCGVICSKAAAETYGLTVLAENIQNRSQNRTRFIVLHRDMLLLEDANKISLCFSLPHTTGSLYSVLGRFAMNGLNLTKIESRPACTDCVREDGGFEYDFYLDFTGNVANPKTLDLICELSSEMPNFSFLGNYAEQ